MAISTLPTPPSRSDDPANFSSKADDFLGALPVFVTEANALVGTINALEDGAIAAASTATTQAGIATTQAGIATTKAGEAASSASSASASVVAVANYVATIPAGTLNDSITTGTNTWSSSKISAEMVTATGSQTLSNKTLSGVVLNDGYTEEVYALSGTDINPANGSIQTKTLSANTTFTESIADGQSVTLMLNPATYAPTWFSVTWIKPDGATLTAPPIKASVYNCFTFFQIAGVLYGKQEGTA